MEKTKKTADSSVGLKIFAAKSDFSEILAKGFQLLEEEEKPRLTSAYFESPRFTEGLRQSDCRGGKNKR